MKRKLFIFLFIVLILVGISLADTYWDGLTKGYADTLYCAIGTCGGVSSGSNATNITGIGKADNLAVWFNETHLTYNTSAIGGGSDSGDNETFNESMVREIITDNNNSVNAYWTDNNMTVQGEIVDYHVIAMNYMLNSNISQNAYWLANNDTMKDYVLWVNSTNEVGNGSSGDTHQYTITRPTAKETVMTWVI